MSRKNSIYKKIPLKKKNTKKGIRRKRIIKFERRHVDPCPSGNRGSQIEIHGALKSGGPALIWIGHARTLIFQPSVKSKTGWLSQDSSKAQFRRISSFSPSTTCPFPFRLIRNRRPAFAPLRVFPAARETKTRESRPWAFCPDNYEQLGHTAVDSFDILLVDEGGVGSWYPVFRRKIQRVESFDRIAKKD